jgi:hypothetical protein
MDSMVSVGREYRCGDGIDWDNKSNRIKVIVIEEGRIIF